MGCRAMPESPWRREVRVFAALVALRYSNNVLSFDFSDPTRHPTSKAMEKARLETFTKARWPHDAVKGHGANSKAVST